ncbi:DNA-directed RNA polymerases I, II, and III subunit RPABC3 [Nematocida parisii]|uniref:DNA-directed RNA polymerases I, II, and III subunit RPABC3 n=1 Tax=Nematocida parisii (strain ERTm3) TaxID=935791 RepID=I3EG75_NEMP3|nr:uncharacterized protein NEPG_01283 [Nematocida parisii ERTm1]EIJ88222.1 hypothetical protein NEQG_01666 [Nematocida parisii ERTm3]KAI5125354.1 DNA-directed RNA polymerases I, II, and III subunit RPABC3 [Nematocida parisii]EIJ93711.1 hypothetical protein NEPG_01283 [Nematocida parisii ERTm1]KAI5125478.1 DNA-directed RNA polymerases I, II, and III subunit RPABC3 [Nematocida parisii]KAI5140640.1 DNA-directed RNA polymerases I, II, and III subunit RPABC3 [Nematocida parisii]|eukprot:XP_013059111.1 hypothetical protein NEPG_01283 [Nematocida parisii ERTm1]
MQIFVNSFTLSDIDVDGKAFDEVSRGVFTNESTTLIMDYHAGLFNHKKMDKVNIALFSEEADFTEKDIPEKYGYLMGNGIVYETKINGNRQTIDISFSGLLVSLDIEVGIIKDINNYKRLYIGVEGTQQHKNHK